MTIFHKLYKHWKILALFILTVLLLLSKLFWLLIGVIGIILLRFVFLFLIKKIKNKTLSKIAYGATFFIIIFIISIGMKLFVFGIFRIPSSSMENTLYPDDIILVNKLTYGPKLPSSPFEIPWVNFLFYLNDNARSSIDKEWWGYHRFSGASNIKLGDVLVFQTSRTFFLVKRCVALPGDKFKIVNGDIYTNDVKYTSLATVKENYKITIKNKEGFYSHIDSIKIDAMIFPSSKVDNEVEAILSQKEYSRIESLSSVINIEKKIRKNQDYIDLFTVENNRNWTIDNMGTFKVPKKGLQIELNAETFNVYKKTLQKFEKVRLEKKDSVFLLDGKVASNYSFKKDYIFVLGDNRKNSKDSRFIGFVPIESIIGKVQCVLYSNYNEKFHWDRLFKGVN